MRANPQLIIVTFHLGPVLITVNSHQVPVLNLENSKLLNLTRKVTHSTEQPPIPQFVCFLAYFHTFTVITVI